MFVFKVLFFLTRGNLGVIINQDDNGYIKSRYGDSISCLTLLGTFLLFKSLYYIPSNSMLSISVWSGICRSLLLWTYHVTTIDSRAAHRGRVADSSTRSGNFFPLPVSIIFVVHYQCCGKKEGGFTCCL